MSRLRSLYPAAGKRFEEPRKRKSIMIHYKGETKSLSRWAKELGFRHGTLFHRLRAGWTTEAILETPIVERSATGNFRRKQPSIYHKAIKGILVISLVCLVPPAKAGWWSDFCERHLIAEDPYQYEHLSNDQLIGAFWRHKNEKFESKALINELKSRLNDPYLGEDDREIIEKTLRN